MAIIPPKPISSKKEFTDRLEPRKNFWQRFKTMEKEGSTIINYYGPGGVGKTRLMEELEKNIKGYAARKDIAFIHIDFKDKPSTLSLLQKMRRDLEKYNCAFPLFSTAIFATSASPKLIHAHA